MEYKTHLPMMRMEQEEMIALYEKERLKELSMK